MSKVSVAKKGFSLTETHPDNFRGQPGSAIESYWRHQNDFAEVVGVHRT